MTLKQLEYFLAIAENGSITKAANSLRISQPPLSLQLKGLEEELGCQLFIRDKKNMIITPKGILLRERAREIMDKVNETLLLMQSANEEERYTIHLGTISSICNRVLPDKVLKLKERYPHVEFVLHEGSTTSILDMLADGTVDFGIVREPFNVGAYSSRPIRDTALGEGGQDYFTAIGKPNFFPADDTQSVALTSLQDTPNIICQNDNIASSLSWAASGIGVAIAPYTSAIQNSDPTLVMKRIDSPEIVSKAHLIWNRSATLTPEQKAFVHLFD